MDNHPVQLNTSAADLFTSVNRFALASRLNSLLHRWWLLFRKYWKLIAVIFAMVVGPVLLLTLLSGPEFESTARMWVPGRINVSEDWSYTEELVNFLGTQSVLLESPTIQTRAMERLLAESKAAGGIHRGLLGGAKAFLKGLLGFSDAAATNRTPSVPFQVKVLEGSKSSTLDLRVTGPDPVSTRKYLNCLMAEYLDFKQASRDQASGQAASSLNTDASGLKSELALAQDKLQNFQASNNVVLLQQQGSGAETYLASLDHQLAVLRTEQRLLESLKPEQWVQTGAIQADAGQSPGDEAAAQQLLGSLAGTQTALFQADQQMQLLTAQRDELAHFLRPRHPKIIKLNQEIATQQQIVLAAQDEAAKQLALRRKSLAAQIQNLEAASTEWNAKAIQTSRQVAEYDQLRQNVQRLQAAYDKTYGLIQNLDVDNRIQQENVAVLDPASVARPVHRLLIRLVMATAVALMLCFGLLYAISLFQDGFTSRSELAAQLGEPVVGQIPSISFHDSARPLGIEGLEMQRFEFLEAFRNIRASLLFMRNGGTGPKTILITSSVPEEGKSTIALYLAITLAKGGSRVLLIDGDMRRPGLHHYFSLPAGPGLAEILNDEASALEVVLPTGVDNLSFLAAGEARQNPGDLMLNPVWPPFLAALKLRYDYVLLDTPPVAATDDAATLAPKTDGVLFVVRALSTSARIAHGALDVIRQRKANVVGLIFNRAESSPCERQYYQPYARTYHWESAPTGVNGELAMDGARAKEAATVPNEAA